MTFSLKKAFRAAALAGTLTLAGCVFTDNGPDSGASVRSDYFSPGFTESLGRYMARASDAAGNNAQQDADFLGDVISRIVAKYVRPVTREQLEGYALNGMASLDGPYTSDKLIEAVLDGVLHSLDPHSDYITQQESAEAWNRLAGTVIGIGVELSLRDSGITVVSPIPDTPAARAGLKSGDIITRVDGAAVAGMGLDAVVALIQGPAGTQVKLTVSRPGANAPFDVTVMRDHIPEITVRSGTLGNDIGYLRVTRFTEVTQRQLERAIEELLAAQGDTLRGFVLDLRGNPGGLVDAAAGVADSFLSGGKIVSTGDRNGYGYLYTADATDLIGGLPLTVLIDGGSASASEIVAGALQDSGRAVVLGKTSYGKGSVQSITPLRGQGSIRLTTGLYYTPSGNSIQGRGIEPDILTRFPGTASDPEYGGKESDLQGSIANPGGTLSQNGNVTTQFCSAAPAATPDMDALGAEAPQLVLRFRDGSTEPDYMLLCAVAKLRGANELVQIAPLPAAP